MATQTLPWSLTAACERLGAGMWLCWHLCAFNSWFFVGSIFIHWHFKWFGSCDSVQGRVCPEAAADRRALCGLQWRMRGSGRPDAKDTSSCKEDWDSRSSISLLPKQNQSFQESEFHLMRRGHHLPGYLQWSCFSLHCRTAIGWCLAERRRIELHDFQCPWRLGGPIWPIRCAIVLAGVQASELLVRDPWRVQVQKVRLWKTAWAEVWHTTVYVSVEATCSGSNALRIEQHAIVACQGSTLFAEDL